MDFQGKGESVNQKVPDAEPARSPSSCPWVPNLHTPQQRSRTGSLRAGDGRGVDVAAVK